LHACSGADGAGRGDWGGCDRYIAYQSVARAAARLDMSVRSYIAHGPDQTAVSVMAQDIVSVSAIAWASMSVALSHYTGVLAFDAMGSIGVGLGLGWLAYYLGKRNIEMLNGQSVPGMQVEGLAGLLENDPVRPRSRPMPPWPLAAVTPSPPPRHVVPCVFAGGREDLASASGLHGAG
jgi:hypothetical protein